MKQDDFVTKAIESKEESDIDTLALNWLKNVTKEYGEIGQHAEQLLEVVGKMLCIYYEE